MSEAMDPVEVMARTIYALAPPLEWIPTGTGGSSGHSGQPIPFDDERSGHYRKTAERHARAALSAAEAAGLVLVKREALEEAIFKLGQVLLSARPTGPAQAKDGGVNDG